MDVVAILLKEHEDIKFELDELDFIIESSEINYSNLVHTFWKLCSIWDNHEKKEEELFEIMKGEGFEIPIETILLEHKSLRGHIEKITGAINSGNDFEVRKSLNKNLREFVDVLRKHSEDEEEILAGVIVDQFSLEGIEKIKVIVGKYA